MPSSPAVEVTPEEVSVGASGAGTGSVPDEYSPVTVSGKGVGAAGGRGSDIAVSGRAGRGWN
jgi:hypothetical protein